MKNKKEVTIVEHRRLSIRDTAVNCIPTVVGGLFSLFLIIIGFDVIDKTMNAPLNDFAQLMFVIVALPILIRLVPIPITTYHVERGTYECADKNEKQ